MSSLTRHSTTPALVPPSQHHGRAGFLRRRSPSQGRPGRIRHDSTGELDRVFDTGRGESFQSSQPTRKPRLIDDADEVVKSYGVDEGRDSFFDAAFVQPNPIDPDELHAHAEETLPYAFRKKDPLSLSNFFPKQCHDIRGVALRVTTTRRGIKLLKSFLAFFVAYILCLVPVVAAFLGRYNYIMVISTIVNHPGRTLGAQFDGALMTLLGTATGLGWGAFGLWLSTSTSTARVGYGGILATFLFLYIFGIACLRSYYVRSYQLVLCAGIAISYTCLAEVSATEVSWSKLLRYIIPWALGEAISLVVCCLVAPDAGARPLAVELHKAFGVMQDGLLICRPDQRRMRRRLSQAFVDMSQAYRDLVLDFSITLFDPNDVLSLRNLIQGVIRSLLSLKTDTALFDLSAGGCGSPTAPEQSTADFAVKIGQKGKDLARPVELELLGFVASHLADPTQELLEAMRLSLSSCDALLMEMCGHRRYLGPPSNVSNDVVGSLVRLRRCIIKFGTCQDQVLSSDRLPPTYGDFPEIVKLFAFCRPVQQAATAVEALLVKINEMEQRKPEYPKFHKPSYPFWKMLHRSNAQVRHDRGGVTAGSYFRSFDDIAEIIQKIKSRDFKPLPKEGYVSRDSHDATHATLRAAELEDESSEKKSRIGHQVWSILHGLQGFETKFGLKTAIVTSLLSIPAWLTSSNDWWDKYEVWWAVTMAWLIMGPRTGGNIQDLFARNFCAVIGALWGGLSYAAGRGNPFVTAVFALIFMLPMIYRYTQSAHTRSGLVGCITFTVVSLAAQTSNGHQSSTVIAATRGAAIVVGVTASVIVNWILWPFVARHDLRKATSAMLFYCSIIYRSVVSQYVYYESGQDPTPEDIIGSEILEGRLREGFVRLRQLMGLTRHELRMRAPFDPLPYSALIDASERFFDYVIAVRQSSLFYHPHFVRDNADAAADLLGVRRDAIATILTNLYVLSGALRADRKVPKYLPSAAIARQHLLERMKEMELRTTAKDTGATNVEKEKGAGMAPSSFSSTLDAKKWAQIYSYSYNESLTGCVEQVEELEKYTKAIVGELGFDVGYRDGELE